MTKFLYDGGREGFLSGDIDWDTHVIKAVIIDSADYTQNQATHRNLSDIPAGARVATSSALTGKTVTGGVADADDVTILDVTGDQSEAVVLYKDTGTESTSRLILFTNEGTGLPITPTGDDVILTWDSGANKIFKL